MSSGIGNPGEGNAHTGFSPGQATETSSLTESSGDGYSSGPVPPPTDKVYIIETVPGGVPAAVSAPSTGSWQNLHPASVSRKAPSPRPAKERRPTDVISVRSRDRQSVHSSGSSLQASREVLRKKKEVARKLYEAQQAKLELEELETEQQAASRGSVASEAPEHQSQRDLSPSIDDLTT